jgi:hypothetical protein
MFLIGLPKPTPFWVLSIVVAVKVFGNCVFIDFLFDVSITNRFIYKCK